MDWHEANCIRRRAAPITPVGVIPSGDIVRELRSSTAVKLGRPLVNVEFSIWMATKTRWAHLTKVIPMPCVPRVGEFMKFRNAEQGDYFAWRITQVTYREHDDGVAVEIHTELLDDIDQRGYSFEAEAEFDEYMNSYVRDGWTSHNIRPNRRYKPPADSRDPNDSA